jgi:uncharacterized protein YkwD
MFGSAHSNIPVEFRLDRLESEVFHHTNPDWDVARRIARLKETLVGGGTAAGSADTQPYPQSNGDAMPAQPYASQPAGQQYGSQPMAPYYGAPQYSGQPQYGYGDPNSASPYGVPQYGTSGDAGADPANSPAAAPAIANYVPPAPGDLNSPEFQQEQPMAQLQQFALQIINDARTSQGFSPLTWDDTAAKVAVELVTDNCARNTVSHQNKNGDNPDVRYTKAGGSDCLVESICSLKVDGKPVMNKTLVYNVIKDMCTHQDDRDALFNPHATHGAFQVGVNSGGDRIIACTEIVTKQADLAPMPVETTVGEKLDVKGVITGPYKFARITVAWEGILPTSGEDLETQDEALPYFPPLDYEAFAKKSERDWEKGKQLLQLTGIGLAIAGGVFFPPIAMAAPLIAATGPTMMKPGKAPSDIPIRGGVRTDGITFSHKLPLSKDNKEGIYYVTVWAASDADPIPFAISRRAIIAKTNSDTNSSSDLKISQEKPETDQVTPVKDEKKTEDKPQDPNETSNK